MTQLRQESPRTQTLTSPSGDIYQSEPGQVFDVINEDDRDWLLAYRDPGLPDVPVFVAVEYGNPSEPIGNEKRPQAGEIVQTVPDAPPDDAPPAVEPLGQPQQPPTGDEPTTTPPVE